VDNEKTIEVYTDGACPNNGQEGATGGLGIHLWIPAKESGRTLGLAYDEFMRERYGEPTNQKCELLAALYTVAGACINHRDGAKKDQLYDEDGTLNMRFLIYSDSKYVVDGINTWLPNWKRNGWKNSKKKLISNLQMWKDLDAVLSFGHLRGVFSFYHVAGHSGNPGNDAADEAARKASDFARQEQGEDESHSDNLNAHFVAGNLMIERQGASDWEKYVTTLEELGA
tara:strand:- start:9388 stop:10068 length:681 start_codon:yes stop_codon:yes gene_type:complete